MSHLASGKYYHTIPEHEPQYMLNVNHQDMIINTYMGHYIINIHSHT